MLIKTIKATELEEGDVFAKRFADRISYTVISLGEKEIEVKERGKIRVRKIKLSQLNNVIWLRKV